MMSESTTTIRFDAKKDVTIRNKHIPFSLSKLSHVQNHKKKKDHAQRINQFDCVAESGLHILNATKDDK